MGVDVRCGVIIINQAGSVGKRSRSSRWDECFLCLALFWRGIQVGDEIDMKYLYIYIFTTYAKTSWPVIENPAIIHKRAEEMLRG